MRWKDHKPLLRYRIVSGLTCLALVCAFALFLLVGLSLPIIKSIYLLDLRSTNPQDVPTSIATELRFGVWGVCASSALVTNSVCIGPQLGYEVPGYLVDLIALPASVIEAVRTGLTVILILHPVAAGVAFITMFFSLFLASHAFSIFVLILTIIAAIISSIVLGIDLALVITARNKLATFNDLHLDLSFGNGVWMMVAAVVLVWLAVVLLSARACYCCGVRRHHHHDDY